VSRSKRRQTVGTSEIGLTRGLCAEWLATKIVVLDPLPAVCECQSCHRKNTSKQMSAYYPFPGLLLRRDAIEETYSVVAKGEPEEFDMVDLILQDWQDSLSGRRFQGRN
jgi:hypothetical protein